MTDSHRGRVAQWLKKNVLGVLIIGCYVFAWTAATLHLVSLGVPGWLGAILLALMILLPLAVFPIKVGYGA